MSRAVSTTLSYTLTLSIATLLVTGLLIAGSEYVTDRREEVIRDELTVVGEQVAADLARADRLVVAGKEGNGDAGDDTISVRLDQTFPERVSGSTYQISLAPATDEVVLTATDPAVTVTVSVTTETGVADSTVDGGTVRIEYDSSDDELEVTDA